MSDLKETLEALHSKRCANGIAHNLLRREVLGRQLKYSNPFENAYPDRFRMSVEQIIPRSAMEAGNVFMGFTDCGRYLLSYTARPSENFGVSWGDLTFTYKLHFWLFVPYKPARKVSSILLFDNNGVCDNNLLIEISQWKKDDTRILITGHSANPDGDSHHTQYFATIATIPPTQPCIDCQYILDEEQEEDYVDWRTLQPCLRHGLTIHLTFDHVSPFPKFDANTQLRYNNSVTFNTGNVIHVFSYKLLEPTPPSPSSAAASPRHEIAPLLLSSNPLSVPYLQCDVWLKCDYSLNTILTKGPIRDDTKYLEVDRNKWKSSGTDYLAEEQNILSIKAQESILAVLPYVNPSNETKDIDDFRLVRRLSQSSLDSSDLSLNSPNPPKSPSPFRSVGTMASSDKKATNMKSGNKSPANISLTLASSPSKQKLMLPPQERKFFKRRISSTSPSTSTSSSPVKEAPLRKLANEPSSSPVKSNGTNISAYDVFDISGEDVLQERSFSSFRKRRLADKNSPLAGLGSPRSPRYEVGGGESPRHPYDNLSYPRSPRGMSYVLSPVMSPNSELDVLRPINNNLNSNVVKPPSFSPKQIDETGDDLEKFINDFYCGNESRSRSSTPKRILVSNPLVASEDKAFSTNPNAKPTLAASINCIAKVLRSYIHKDDDNVSVITDIEDDYNLGQPFPVALPLDVHGTAYGQLNMISNAKAEKCQVPVVQILQRTLDIELLCNEVAGMICHSADKYYCSCCDYDAAIVDVCPERGTITAIVYVLVQAASLKMSSRPNDKTVHTSLGYQDPRKKYEAVFTFAWEPSQEHCRILYRGNLTELSTVTDPWHPTKHILNLVKTRSGKFNMYEDTKVLTNQLAVQDFTSVDELTDSKGMITVYCDDSTKTERRSVFSGFSMRSQLLTTASTTSSSDSSDDED
ncbi:unnamed protein product [Allacma fusca]|uniref:DDB1- and CUL4-associated factor 15 WD40 repeat-containing domain-containing protein n=1 Tax=Allacma fusca TaxID=39272 RepID=A0A8J2LTW3_9HEXA|nr:unnamed protein product [Allacma fusca]